MSIVHYKIFSKSSSSPFFRLLALWIRKYLVGRNIRRLLDLTSQKSTKVYIIFFSIQNLTIALHSHPPRFPMYVYCLLNHHQQQQTTQNIDPMARCIFTKVFIFFSVKIQDICLKSKTVGSDPIMQCKYFSFCFLARPLLKKIPKFFRE